MALTNSIFKLFTIDLICSTLWGYAALVYLGVLILLKIVHYAKGWVKIAREQDEQSFYIRQFTISNSFGITRLPSHFTETEQREQIQFYNLFWLLVNTVLLASLTIVANVEPEFVKITLVHLDIRLLNALVTIVWSFGALSNVLIRLQK